MVVCNLKVAPSARRVTLNTSKLSGHYRPSPLPLNEPLEALVSRLETRQRGLTATDLDNNAKRSVKSSEGGLAGLAEVASQVSASHSSPPSEPKTPKQRKIYAQQECMHLFSFFFFPFSSTSVGPVGSQGSPPHLGHLAIATYNTNYNPRRPTPTP